MYPNFNFYNPYMMRAASTSIKGLSGIRSLFKGTNLTSIISGTQKTLGFVNQALPVIKQVHPIIKNASTMFKVMNEFKKDDSPTNQTKEITSSKETVTNEKISESKGPTFFI